MAQPPVTVVVLNWCAESVSWECLRSLDASDYHPLTVLLVDNGSPDDSGDRLREAFPHIDYLQTGANLGYAGGDNRGIEWALERGAEYILVLNNDTVVEPEAIPRLVQVATESNGRFGGAVPKILYHDQPDRIWFGGGAFKSLRGLGIHWREGERDDPHRHEEPCEVTFMTGACILLSADALREIGGFDETFFAYVEDAELSLRLREAGFRMVYEPGARVLHHAPPPGTPPSPFQIRQRDWNRNKVMRRHYTFWARLPFWARFFLTRGVLYVVYLLRGERERARAILEGLGSG